MPRYLTTVLLVFLLLPSSFVCAQNWRYNKQSSTFYLPTEPNIVKFPKAREDPKWEYFWEFGDGHFSFEENPKHTYVEAGQYTPRLILTPLYSSTRPPGPSEQKISANGSSQPPPRYNLQKRNAFIETNAKGQTVPGQYIQMVGHYQYTGQSNGHVLIFYNKKKEIPLGIKPLALTDERLYYKQELRGANKAVAAKLIDKRLGSAAQIAARTLLNAHEDVVAYRIEGLKPGTQERLFLSFFTSKRLSLVQDKGLDVSVTILWAPDGSSFDSRRNIYEYNMEILKIYDPNRIQVTPRTAYYRKGFPKHLEYTVQFQNVAKGRVSDVRVALPLDEGLELLSAEVVDRDPIEMELCPTGRPDKALPCYTFRRVQGSQGDSLVVQFHNIGLEGKRIFQNKKGTKGYVRLRVKTQDQKHPAHRMGAAITFQEVEPIETNTATTRWRRNTLALRPGISLAPTLKGFDNLAEEIGERPNIGLLFQNAPLRTGFAYGAEVSWARYHFGRTLTEVLEEEESSIPFGSLFVTEEEARLSYLDINGWLGYQVHGLVRAYGGFGLSAPTTGEVVLNSTITAPDSDFVIIQSEDTAEFGLLKSNDPASIFQQDTELRNSVGFNGQLGLELGILDVASVGIARQWRFFPSFYNDECATIGNWTASLRFHFVTVGSKR